MTYDVLNELSNMLYQKGNHCELGWHKKINDALYDNIKGYSNKPYCLASNWCWWDLQANEETKLELTKLGLFPAIVFCENVIEDQQGRFEVGHQCKSSLLMHFEEPAFFETRSTLYVLIGAGTRKTVDANLAARDYFGKFLIN